MGDVVLTYLHPHDISYSFHGSLVQLIGWDMAHDQRLDHWNAIQCGSGGLITARNKSVSDFLEADSEWLLVIDADMGFTPDALDRLLAVADPTDRPIVGGLCFAQKEISPDGSYGFRCEPRVTIFDWVSLAEGEPKRFVGRRHYPVNTLVQCAATGMAFVLIHRRVLERIRDEHGTWFDRVKGSDGELLGEDISFFLRAGALGLPVHVHTGVRTTHMKTMWLGEPDYWTWYPAEPARDETAVIVPVMGRPEHAEPFMASLRASTGLARAYAVCHDGDDPEVAKAWDHAGAEIVDVPAESISFAAKVNAGYRHTSGNVRPEPWVFIVGSDVRFRPGWLDQAQEVAYRYQAQVIGTNDLGNPRVIAGEHATHLLISRDYIEQTGASWDPPGTVCHEGYRHWFVDDEIVTAAKQRGVWQMASGSIVEHLHPAWGKAPNDDIYELGQASAKKDQQLFQWRLDRHVRAA